MENTEMEQHFVDITALGRSFELGCLYNYCNDNILTGKFLRSLTFFKNILHMLLYWYM